MLDNILKILQIAAYILTGVLATLTYKNARKGLLNPIHVEFQKKVMDRLAKLSDELASEFDSSSENYWVNDQHTIKLLKNAMTNYILSISSIKENAHLFGIEIEVSDTEIRFSNLRANIQSDPFIPENIRVLLLKLLTNRTTNTSTIIHNRMRKYCKELVEGKHDLSSEWHIYGIHNEINSELYENGLGISQIQEEVNKIRIKIKEYFDEFNPNK